MPRPYPQGTIGTIRRFTYTTFPENQMTDPRLDPDYDRQMNKNDTDNMFAWTAGIAVLAVVALVMFYMFNREPTSSTATNTTPPPMQPSPNTAPAPSPAPSNP